MSTPPYQVYGHEAMATTFEVIIAQADIDPGYGAQAAAAVFAEVDRLEEQLSRFRPGNDITRLSHLKSGERMSVCLAVWDCLALSKSVYEETEGAFDITIGPLMQLWRTPEGELQAPQDSILIQARASIGSRLYDMEEDDGYFVRVHAERMVFDLGAVGKGYALDQAVQVLQDWGIQRAFLNAGDSTLLALEAPEGEENWEITLAEGRLQHRLVNSALSGSGFQVKGAHIMNPRTLRPVPVQERRRYAQAPAAALSDALSTAFTIMEPTEIQALCARYPEVSWLEV